MSSAILNTVHNLHYYLDIFRRIRHSISYNSFNSLKKSLTVNETDKEDAT